SFFIREIKGSGGDSEYDGLNRLPTPLWPRPAQGEDKEMKYFTPDLVAMGQSGDDAVLNRQEELWDEACQRYFDHLEALKPCMPAGLRHIVDSYYLHDAVVHGLGRRDRVFVMMLQLDTPPQSLLTFTYELVEEPTINAGALPPGRCGTGPMVEWQYNEI